MMSDKLVKRVKIEIEFEDGSHTEFESCELETVDVDVQINDRFHNLGNAANRIDYYQMDRTVTFIFEKVRGFIFRQPERKLSE